MLNTLFYWHSILGNELLKEKYQEKLDALLAGNYKEADLDLKKSKGHRIYSIRINKSDRLLLGTIKYHNQSHLVVLEEILNHDYQKSKFLHDDKALGCFLEKQTTELKKATAITYDDFDEIESISDIKPKTKETGYDTKRLDLYNGELIVLNPSQQEAIASLDFPQLLISGPPGSGKTVVMHFIIENFVRYLLTLNPNLDLSQIKIAVVAKSDILMRAIKKQVEELQQRGVLPIVTFVFATYNQLVGKQVGLAGRQFTDNDDDSVLDDFYAWLKGYIDGYHLQLKAKQKHKGKAKQDKVEKALTDLPDVHEEFLKPIHHHRIYQAFRVLSYRSANEGKKTLPFTDPNELRWAELALESYINHLSSQGKIDPAFFVFQPEPVYDLIISDETQDLSRLQGVQLPQFAKEQKIVYLLDTNQSLFDAKSMTAFLLQQFPRIVHKKLPEIYRSPYHHIQLLNVLLSLKHRAVGGIADKEAYHQVMEAKDEQKTVGGVVWLKNNLAAAEQSSLQTLTQHPECILITHRELMSEAKEKFPQALILSVEQAKGLDFRCVVAYKLFTHPMARHASQLIEAASGVERLHRAKEGRGDEIVAPFFNQVLTTFSRATTVLVICEDDQHQIKPLLLPLQEATHYIGLAEARALMEGHELNVDNTIHYLIEKGKISKAYEMIQRHKGGDDSHFKSAIQAYEAAKAGEKPSADTSTKASLPMNVDQSFTQNHRQEPPRIKNKRAAQTEAYSVVERDKPKKELSRSFVDEITENQLGVKEINTSENFLEAKNKSDSNSLQSNFFKVNLSQVKATKKNLALNFKQGSEDIQMKSAESNSLHLAAKIGDCKLMEKLFLAGVDPSIKNSKGQTAVDLANNYLIKLKVKDIAKWKQQLPSMMKIMKIMSIRIDETKQGLQEIEVFIKNNDTDSLEKWIIKNESNPIQLTILSHALVMAVDCSQPNMVARLIQREGTFQINHALIKAVKQGNKAMTELLLINGADATDVVNNEYSALECAAAENLPDLITLMNEYAEDGQIAFEDLCYGLMAAALRNSIDSFKVILQIMQEFDVSICEEFCKHNVFKDLLNRVAQNGSIEMLRAIIHNKKFVFQFDQLCFSLNVAALTKNIDVFKLIIKEMEKFPDEKWRELLHFELGDDIDVLSIAIEKGSYEMVDILIKKDINIHEKIYKYKLSPLMLALFSKEEEIAKLLIMNNFGLNLPDFRGQTALHHAASFSLSLVEVLCGRGLKINAIDFKGRTPIMHAIINNNHAAIVFLLNKGADLKIKDKEGITAFMFACAFGPLDLVKRLHEIHAPHGRGISGFSSLLSAIQQGRVDVLKYLIEDGYNINEHYHFCHRKNVSPLMQAVGYEDPDKAYMMTVLLVKAGADVQARDSYNLSVLACIRMPSHDRCYRFLDQEIKKKTLKSSNQNTYSNRLFSSEENSQTYQKPRANSSAIKNKTK